MHFEKKRIGEAVKQRELELEDIQEPVFSVKKSMKHVLKDKSYSKYFKKTQGVWKRFLLIPILIVAFFFIVQGMFTLYSYSSDKSFLQKVFTPIIEELEKDDNGFVNILLVGHGGGNHDGPDLTDSMIVASIDTEKKSVVMLSVPRDFWVSTNQFGESRINELYRNAKLRLEGKFGLAEDLASDEAMNVLMKELELITEIKIPYYAQIDFQGLVDVVNKLGGIPIEVEENIYDEKYPDGNWGFETFDLKAGSHVLDGETALKYSRSRHGSSDFNRAGRQQEVIQAVKDTALSAGVLSSPRKIQGLFNVIQKHFRTNLSVKELVSLAIIGSKVNRDSLFSAVLNDDWNSRGGFLGTPPRVDYGGAFVLIPYSGFGNLSRIHIFTSLLFQYRELQFEKFEVLNGTQLGGLASKAAKRLDRYGINVSSVGNIRGKEYYKDSELWVYKNYALIEKIEPLLQEIFDIKIINKEGVYVETDVIGTFIIGTRYK